MRMEHVDLRRRKKELKELAAAVERVAFKDFQKNEDAAAKLLILSLRDHIFKENNATNENSKHNNAANSHQ